ncbi:membrane protein YdbS with pleckstrin-like domain [Bacillus tianshenii]|uniref:Membrane protein YdbS with pleckstrin-like domain n=1 Tax=Sutcliffiella tianshenii TaxID=1463404 RepID=A0ABS2P3Y5_9BACI|nr:PH domain-containing protein [Bacillus tianshenii]MBM7621674.1 membrane protein YdbS with pleckstrin-like domain [Bacillus tianshenii]
MRPEPSQRINRKALSVWRIAAVLNGLFYIALFAGFWFVQQFFDTPWWLIAAATGLLVLFLIASIFIFPSLQWKRWRYEVHEHEIDIQRGIFIKRRTLIPMVRVQHVDTKQGPILKRYHLSTVTISTAATVHEIPALDEEQADTLRDYISRLARVTEDDV